MSHSGRARGSLEQDVLACLAAADSPLSVQDVVDELGSGLAYTTVMTTLSRLYGKNAVAREQSGRAYRYSLPEGPDAARSSMTAHSMHRLLDGGEDRRGVLLKFVEELSDEDERLLRQALRGDGDPASPPRHP